MKRNFSLILVSCLLMACSLFELFSATDEPPANTDTSTNSPDSPAPAADGIDRSIWKVYRNSAYQFEIMYPPEGLLNEIDAMHARITLPIVSGTNLLEKYLLIDVGEEIASPEECIDPLVADVDPSSTSNERVTIHTVEFLKQRGSEGDMGKYYNWESYSTISGNVCVRFTFVLNSFNPQNYSDPPPEFDKPAETAIYTQILVTYLSSTDSSP